jgi:hypothetical protein
MKRIQATAVAALFFLAILVLNACKNDETAQKSKATSTPAQAQAQEIAEATPSATALPSEPFKLTVNAATPGIITSPLLYGGFFEEINHAGDGGLYAEMISNRSFEENQGYPSEWVVINEGKGKGKIVLDDKVLLNKSQGHSLAFTITSAGDHNAVGISNRGYWGINLLKSSVYKLSFYAKGGADFKGGLHIRLETSDGKTVLAEDNIQQLKSGWQQYPFSLTANESSNPCFRKRHGGSSPTGFAWI